MKNSSKSEAAAVVLTEEELAQIAGGKVAVFPAPTILIGRAIRNRRLRKKGCLKCVRA